MKIKQALRFENGKRKKVRKPRLLEIWKYCIALEIILALEMSKCNHFHLRKVNFKVCGNRAIFHCDCIRQNEPIEGGCTLKGIGCRPVVLRLTPLYIPASTPGVFGSPASCSGPPVSDSRKVWISGFSLSHQRFLGSAEPNWLFSRFSRFSLKQQEFMSTFPPV